jgi:chemotaxis protein MotB
MRPRPRPIIIRRTSEASRHAAPHGGAWKVAYADFVTAMMAFFLLLWLISSASDNTRKGLADFFSDAKVNIGPPGGVGGVLDGMTMLPSPLPVAPFEGQPRPPMAETGGVIGLPRSEDGDAAIMPAVDPGSTGLTAAEQRQLDHAAAAILSTLQASPDLRRFEESLVIDRTKEGLRIQLLDREQVAMFPLGSEAMHPHTRKLLEVVVRAIAGLSYPISIRGHTDALPFAPGAAYDNWRLSADRASATRRVMIEAGLDAARVAEVVGKGDGEPLFPGHADDPRNRRISIVLLHP